MYKKIISILSVVFFSCFLFVNQVSALVINHNSVAAFDQIPSQWIEQAKQMFRLSYGHTSHGSQIVTGLEMLSSENSFFDYTTGADGFLCDGCINGADDLGNPDFYTWAGATRNYLNDYGGNTNVIMWSWCGQVSYATVNDIQNQYLNNMAQLENDFPNVKFIYMTGHLDGTGETGNLKQRNKQIRDYAIANNKILFDFADIESYDPSGNYYPDGSDDCSWCVSWCASHICPACSDCAHSECFNCYNKGKAFWYMMARLAGWDGGTGQPDTTPPSAPTGVMIQ